MPEKPGLGDGTRVPKHALRIAAMGAVDEANAAIGVARLSATDGIEDMLTRIQNDLFDLGADLCTPKAGKKAEGALRIVDAQVTRLEHEIDCDERRASAAALVCAAGWNGGAYLHLARTIVRQARTSDDEIGDTGKRGRAGAEVYQPAVGPSVCRGAPGQRQRRA